MKTATENTVIENNKKIAEFMGITLKGGGKSVFDDPNLKYFRKSEYKKDGLCKWCGNDVSHGHNLNCYVLNNEKLKYHSSWNQLLKVVERIEGLETNKQFLDRESFNHYQKVLSLPIYTPIEAVYKAVIAFIDWYNENK